MMYVCVGHVLECQVVVSLRNANLRPRSKCQFALMPGQDIRYIALHDKVGTTFLANGGWRGQRNWPFATYVFAERSG